MAQVVYLGHHSEAWSKGKRLTDLRTRAAELAKQLAASEGQPLEALSELKARIQALEESAAILEGAES